MIALYTATHDSNVTAEKRAPRQKYSRNGFRSLLRSPRGPPRRSPRLNHLLTPLRLGSALLLGPPQPTRELSRCQAPAPILLTTFFRRGLPFVVSLITVSSWSGVANVYVQRRTLHARGSLWWYVAGTALAAGHLLFVPWIAPSCQAIMENGEGTDINQSLDEWLAVNSVRMLSVDLAAWAAFVVAVVKTLRA
ncbi:hypothetical protein ACHAPT_010797 [Fusarium lateritium]